MQVLLTLILGAILGVIADRLWRRVESKPRVKLAAGSFFEAGGGRGIFYSIENVGKQEMAPFKINLFHPDRGSLSIFEPETKEPLRPLQKREFRCYVTHDQMRPNVLAWLEHARDIRINQPLDGRFSLRLQIQNSDSLLYESNQNGNGLARLLLDFAKSGMDAQQPWNAYQELFGETSPAWSRLWANLKLIKGRSHTSWTPRNKANI
jgi:hypothetical protein